MVMIPIFFIQQPQSVFRLEELGRLRWVHVKPVCRIRTSLSFTRLDKMSSGAFLTSSISSALDGSTVHRRKVEILNNPGFD
jgi:hypothetical protein